MTDKLLTMLGFAAKAGKLSYGMNACISSIRSGRAELVLVCGDISPKSQKEIAYHCNKFGVGVISLGGYDTHTVTAAVGRKCGIISVNDSSFANAVTAAASQGGNA